MNQLLHGDSMELLSTLPAGSIDSCVTDPPYELGFMGKKWDNSGIAYNVDLWRQVLRVLKPGGHLLAFGGTRTYHRMVCAIEDAGFEIRDQLQWLYGSGFPKSKNVGNGWGTALKPANEPICLARKPIEGTVAENVLKHGAGALNIDGCRIPGAKGSGTWGTSNATVNRDRKFNASPDMGEYRSEQHSAGRWPANVILDEEAADALDQQSGEDCGAFAPVTGDEPSKPAKNVYGEFSRGGGVFYGDRGGASRFFYCAKTSRFERNAGTRQLDEKPLNWSSGEENPGAFQSENTKRAATNHHPTVKPISLMRWLVRLVTPPKGVVLDPFGGSGSTACACVAERFGYILIEREAEYIEIARNRVAYWEDVEPPNLFEQGEQ